MEIKYYESGLTLSPKNFLYDADPIAVGANKIGSLQLSDRYYLTGHEMAFAG